MQQCPMRRVFLAGLAALLLTTACTDDADSTTTSAGTVARPSTTTTTPPHPTRDLTATPQVWFGPQPPLGANEFGEIRTGPEFYDLFNVDAEWKEGSEQVHVLHFFGEWVAWRSSDVKLKTVVDDLNQRGIAIGIEGGPLRPRSGCSDNIEGFAGPAEVKVMVERIWQAGGRVTYAVLEHGFDAVAQLPDGCEMTLEEAATDMAAYLETVRRTFPDAEFSITETGDLRVETIDAYLTAFKEATGEYPRHLMLDVPYGEPHWPLAARAIEEHVRALDVGLGIFYLGEEEDTSDPEWMGHLRRNVTEYEVAFGGRPDRSIFTSWHDYPQQLLPESASSAYTSVLGWYARTRTEVSAAVSESDGDLVIDGRLLDVSGEPIAGQPVDVRSRSACEGCSEDESGRVYGGIDVLQDYVITGVVPDGATMADVGYRVNDECSCNGLADLLIEEFRYTEAGTENPIVNPGFAAGLEAWSPWGEATQEVGPDGLRVTAAPGQAASINSEMFPVTAGEPFAMTVAASVSPQSDGSGFFTLIFHGEDDAIRRFRRHMRPSRAAIGGAVTDADGRFQLRVKNPPVPMVVEVWYPGSDAYWPALADSDLNTS